MRIRDLIQNQHKVGRAKLVKPFWFQRLRFDKDALMNSVRAGELVDIFRLDKLCVEGQGGEVRQFEPLCSVARHQHTADLALFVVERGAHCV